jgi:hypothetical protein
LVRKVYSGVPEVITTFESRKYCDLECARVRYGQPRRARPVRSAPVVFEAPPKLVNADTNALLRDAVRFHGEEFIRALDEVTRPDAGSAIPWTQWRGT